jgi:tubulin polyglutamylase TTLL2
MFFISEVFWSNFNVKGWVPFVEGESLYWNLSWKGSRYRLAEYEELQSFQRLNHFPNTAIITRKDTLFRLLKKLRMVYGSIYDFFPLTIALPKDYLKFVRIYAEEEESLPIEKRSTWICKPVDLSRGRGIFVFRKLSELTYDCR